MGDVPPGDEAHRDVGGVILRGVGDAKGPMIIMLSSFVAFRQLYLLITTHITDSILPVALAYPIGWVVCAIAMAVYYNVRKRSLLAAA